MGLLFTKQQSYSIDNRSVGWKTYEEYCLYQIDDRDNEDDENENIESMKNEKYVTRHLILARPQRRRNAEHFKL